MKRFWIFLLGLSLIPVAAVANTPPITNIQVRIYEGGLDQGWFRPSHLGVRIDDENYTDNRYDTYLCLKVGSGDCGYSEGNVISYFGTVIYPVCVDAGNGPCIEKFELRSGSSNWQEVEYVRSISAPTRSAEPSIGFPDAGSISLWRSKDVLHQGGEGNYAVVVVSDGTGSRDQTWNYSAIQARILPFTETRGSFREASVGPSRAMSFEGVDYGKRVSFSGYEIDAIWSDRFGKGVRAEWSQGVQTRLTLRIPSSANGWIGGRMSGVDFELTPINEKINRLKITGSPISVSEVEVNIPLADVPEKLKKVYPGIDPPVIGAYFSVGSKHQVAARALEALRDYTKDQATATQTVWGFETVDSTSNRCLADKGRIVGFISTNALSYTNSAPTFADGRLKYSVANMHRNEKGEVIRGSYDLVIRSDAARCLYGFSNAPIEAVVSVTYDERVENVATTVTGERDGWLYISAKNFTYSSPSIEVAISQPEPTPTPTALAPTTAVEKPSSKKTITCVKGTAVKKVSGRSPKCPKGFKKRA